MKEIRRVLRPEGIAVIQVPIAGESTYEDDSIKTPEARLEAFMQHDHVRVYGTDIVDRLRLAGLKAQILRVDQLPRKAIRTHALRFYLTNEIFVAGPAA